METPSKSFITFDISWSTIIKILITAIAVWAFFALREILFMLFVVFIFVAAVNPTIKNLQQHMSRGLAVTLFFTLLVVAIIIISYLFLPKLITQANALAQAIPDAIDKIRPALESLKNGGAGATVNDAISNASSTLGNAGSNAFSAILGFFGGIATVVTGLVLSFYLLLEEKNAREFLYQVMPRNRFEPAYATLRKISHQMGAWIRGQLTIMLFVGVLNAIVYAIIGVPSPLPLGVWSGLAEVIPYIGPVLGVLPGIFVAINTGDILTVVLVIAINFFAIQQIQNFYITPRVMAKAVGLSPVFVILAILVGIALFGVAGAIIALPTAAIASVIIGEWQSLRQLWEEPQAAKKK
jgi:predicted PurR-regulated permease PerM